MNDRVYLELALSKSVEEDASGNYIIRAEASNENLDFQEQIVLQRALIDSKKYFMENGVVSWNHEHKKRDAKGAPHLDPECIIGEPLGVEKIGNKTFVKALLYKGNKYVEDVISKLKANSSRIKTSVGGLRPVIEKSYDSKLGRVVEKVVSVLWDDLALTTAPVNQTLSAVQFVKSLSLGYGTDSASMTGGRSLASQDLDGAKKTKKAIQAVIAAIAAGDVTTPEQGRAFLLEGGVSDKEAGAILEMVVNRRNDLKGVFTMDENLSKSFSDAIEELEKAMKPNGGAAPAPMPPMPTAEEPDEELFEEHSEPDGDEEEEDEEEGDGDGDEGETPPPMPAKPPLKKSREEFGDDVEFLDVSPVLASMSKSLKALAADNKALRAEVASQRELVKSIGAVQLQSAQVLKSIGDMPEMLKSIGETPEVRKSVLNKQGRAFSGSQGHEAPAVSRDELLRKSRVALLEGKMTLREASVLEDRLNKGIAPQPEVLEMLKSIN